MTLRLDDGTTVTSLSEPPQGTRHLVLFGIQEPGGHEVAVKIELIPGALEPERRALEWLDARDGPSPRLRGAGIVTSEEHRGATCLVTDLVGGEAPTSPDGWSRLGEALARLAELDCRDSSLTTLDHDRFLALHDQRVAELNRALGADLVAELPTLPTSYADSPLSLAHGDPGPGNFLDDGATGTLIDWEDAVVCPRGLDLGRAMFIGLLGVGPAGYVGRETEARAEAVRDGFLAASEDRSLAEAQLDWWLGVAGVQFAQRRLERAGEPGVSPWLDAIEILRRALPRTPPPAPPPR
jgi:aminoglycoside phosphotransferase (APT) family kinase protein